MRAQLVQAYQADNVLLAQVTGRPSFADWMGTTSRGQFAESATPKQD